MAKGTVLPPESTSFSDEATGVLIRQVTSHASIHHHPFYYLPAYDDAMQRLVFVSHRTGRPEIYAELSHTGRLVQLSDHEGISEWSIHPSHDGRYVYFTAQDGGWRVDTESLVEEKLVDFGDGVIREKGMVGAAMGTTAVSHDDQYWTVPVKFGSISRFLLIDTYTGKQEVILERDTIGHPEFHPSDNTLIRYAGPYHHRMWIIHRDGTGNRLVYQRDTARKEWIVHETWLPGTHELVVVNWPRGVIAVNIDTGTVRQVCSFNAWHPGVNRKGTLMCADTTYPDRGLLLFNPKDGIGEPELLCLSKSSNQGAHWNTDHCPYDDGPVQVYAPQHTHPHPSFSPDGKQVVFTSDRTGIAQVYEAILASEARYLKQQK